MIIEKQVTKADSTEVCINEYDNAPTMHSAVYVSRQKSGSE